MNFISISGSQEKASISYFRNEKDIFNIEIGREVQPSLWFAEALSFMEKFYPQFLDEIDYIAVDVGPGSFTGIKVVLSFAQAIAIAKNIFIVPVQSLMAYAYFIPNDTQVATIVNAHRNQFYFAIYKKEKDFIKEISKPASLTVMNVEARLKEIKNENLFLVGDKVSMQKFNYLNVLDIRIPLSLAVGNISIHIRQSFLNTDPEEIKPHFIRLPDVFEKK